jgi:hypothetical protein
MPNGEESFALLADDVKKDLESQWKEYGQC